MINYRKWGDKWYKNIIAFSIENPLKTWWKARKYFKFPNIAIHFSNNKYSFPYASRFWQGKLLDINIHDVYWKDKYDSPRHERNPLIYMCLFSRWSLWIVFHKTFINEFGDKTDESMHYWEYLLDYLYYSKSLKLSSYWVTDSKVAQVKEFGNAEDGSEDIRKPMKLYIPDQLISLNKKGLKEFKKLYNHSGITVQQNYSK